MNFSKLLNIFKSRCHTVKSFIKTKKGRNLFLCAFFAFVLMFFAPLFHSAVGSSFIGCVAIPLIVLIWRRFDQKHAIVPAVFLCIPMLLDMIIYHSLEVASCLLIAIVFTIAFALHPVFSYIRKIKDNLYAYLYAGSLCVICVIVASLLTLLVSITWWLFCLLLFMAVVALFFSVVLSTAAYTATDAKRQIRKKQLRQYDLEENSYDFDIFAQDIGLKNDIDRSVKSKVNADLRRSRRTSKTKEKLFYDVEE